MTATVRPDQWFVPAVDALTRFDPVLARVLLSLDGAPPGLSIEGGGSWAWRLHDVRWTPGRSCVLTCRVMADASPDTFAAVELTPEGWTSFDMRSDPALPCIPAALDPSEVAQRVSRLIHRRVRHCAVVPVRYRPGSRCVLRYDVESDAGTLTLFAKLYEPDAFARTAPLVVRLASRPDRAPVPPLAELWPDLHAAVGHAAPGPTVSQVLADRALTESQRRRLGHELGDLLARFHMQTGVTARSVPPEARLVALDRAVVAVDVVDPALAQRLRRLRDQLAVTVPSSGGDVLAHGSFRPGQVVVGDDGELTALDTDGVHRGHPGLDLGTALAHLRWQGLRQSERDQNLGGAEHGLLEGYRSAGGDLGDLRADELGWWQAAALALAAARRYRRLEVSAWARTAGLVDVAESLLAGGTPSGRAGVGWSTRRAVDAADGELVRLLRPAIDEALGQDAVVEAVQRLATRPSGRSVVRLRVAQRPGSTARTVVAKVFADPARARLLHQHLSMLSDGPFGGGALRVPRPLALLERQGALLLQYVDGSRLDLAADGEVDSGIRLAARWLASLHTCDVVLPRTFSVADEVGSVHAWAEVVGEAFPHQRLRAADLGHRWSRRGVLIEGGVQVPIHKDFHAGHVFLCEPAEDVCVIDLDEARQGPPALDVEHFCAYLELLGDTTAAPRRQQLFRREYAAHVPLPVGGDTAATLAAYCWLKIAKQWAMRSGPCRRGAASVREAGVERALGKAEAWLTT